MSSGHMSLYGISECVNHFGRISERHSHKEERGSKQEERINNRGSSNKVVYTVW